MKIPPQPRLAPTGPALRAARQQCSLSIDQLGVIAGVGSATVERIEHGKVKPNRSTLIALGLALEVNGWRQ